MHRQLVKIPMDTIRSYRCFRIEVRPSPSTNDHEVRFFADGDDLITHFWDDMIGLDPDDILVESCPLRTSSESHRATVARCSCGVIGCGSLEVEVARAGDSVEWTWAGTNEPQSLKFLANSYKAEVERVLRDTTWETPDRTAARLLAGRVNREILSLRGLTYSWASGRVRKMTFTVSLILDPGPYQVLVHLPWNAEPPEEIADTCAKLLADKPASWAQAEWFPQRPDLGPPSLAGSSWLRGGS